MHRTLLMCVSLLFVLLCCQCSKSGGNDNWTGTYASTNTQDSLRNLIISSAGSNVLKVEIKAASNGYIHSYAILQHVTVTGNMATINENASIAGETGQFNMQGSMTLTGQDITFVATATKGGNVKNFNFAGSKH